MSHKSLFEITVLPGDGIGPEITPLAIAILQKACELVGGFEFQLTHFAAGAEHYRQTGISLSDEAMAHARSADAILLACMGMPSIRYPDGREIAPQLELREKLDLFAGVRPVKCFAGIPLPLEHPLGKSLDFVLIRESTEGLFSSRESFALRGEGSEQVANDTLKISRKGCERLFDFAFRLGRQRKKDGYKGTVTCVDKANVLGSFYFMRSIFDERAKHFQDVSAEHIYVDAAALQLVKQPWIFDVMVTENMFGDILSDLGAALMGGMGMAPSADIGEHHAVFQPCHGSAPDIVGQGKANPSAMILSAAMMLEWLGQQHENAQAIAAANRIQGAVEKAFAGGELLPCEMGGKSGTEEIYGGIMAQLEKSLPG